MADYVQDPDEQLAMLEYMQNEVGLTTMLESTHVHDDAEALDAELHEMLQQFRADMRLDDEERWADVLKYFHTPIVNPWPFNGLPPRVVGEGVSEDPNDQRNASDETITQQELLERIDSTCEQIFWPGPKLVQVFPRHGGCFYASVTTVNHGGVELTRGPARVTQIDALRFLYWKVEHLLATAKLIPGDDIREIVEQLRREEALSLPDPNRPRTPDNEPVNPDPEPVQPVPSQVQFSNGSPSRPTGRPRVPPSRGRRARAFLTSPGVSGAAVTGRGRGNLLFKEAHNEASELSSPSSDDGDNKDVDTLSGRTLREDLSL